MTVALHHRLEGPPGAPVLVLGSSLGTTLESWDAQAAALSDSFRVLRFDHRGHGGSPGPPGPYTIDALADDVIALLDRVGAARASYCGTSLGGMIGMALALRAPERIDRLVLACTTAHLAPPSTWTERAATVREHGMAAIADTVLGRWFTGETPRAFVDAFLSCAPEGYAGCCEAIAGHDLRAEMSAIRAPTLVIAGAEDQATPIPLLVALRDAIPDARLEVIAGGAHQAAAEQPEAFNRALRAFLDPMRVRREVLGDEHVDRAAAGTTSFTADFQDLITRYAWGEIWTRPGLDRRTRSAITLTALTALGHHNELALHVHAARRNGLSEEEIGEVLLQAAIYCGVPAANAAFAIAQRELRGDGPP